MPSLFSLELKYSKSDECKSIVIERWITDFQFTQFKIDSNQSSILSWVSLSISLSLIFAFIVRVRVRAGKSTIHPEKHEHYWAEMNQRPKSNTDVVPCSQSIFRSVDQSIDPSRFSL